MDAVAEFTLPEKILHAAHALESAGVSPFTAEALTVAAWERYPRTFGLRSFEDRHPDSNKVLASIMGDKGVARKGWIVRVGQKLYQLTPAGHEAVRRLKDAGEPSACRTPSPHIPPAAAPRLTREDEAFLRALFDSAALQKHREGRPQEWTFADACRFWGVTDAMQQAVLDERLDNVGDTLARVLGQLGRREMTLSDGRSVDSRDLRELREVHEQLVGRFTRHLNLIRNRVLRG